MTAYYYKIKLFETVVAQWHQGVTVNATVVMNPIPTRGNYYLLIFFFFTLVTKSAAFCSATQPTLP